MDVVADAAVKVAVAARPNDAALEKVDQPAPSDQVRPLLLSFDLHSTN